MKIKIEIIEDKKASKSYMKAIGQSSFVYYVVPGGYSKNDRRQQEELVRELNYQLRNRETEEADVYSLKNELKKLEPGRAVWIEIKDCNINLHLAFVLCHLFKFCYSIRLPYLLHNNL